MLDGMYFNFLELKWAKWVFASYRFHEVTLFYFYSSFDKQQ